MAKKAKRRTRKRQAKFLIFVDTNILLDFYRVRGRESGLTILSHIGKNLDRFITGSQVEMEFKKHRQRVILEAHGGLKTPDMGGLQLPAFLAEAKQSKALGRNKEELGRLSKALKARMSTILHNPTTQDAVYQVAQRLFRTDSPWNLDREKKIRHSIRRLAHKRFMLGYPPRKTDDTSMGDAVNWEWVIHCAIESGCDVIIVSRDTDYGIFFDGKPVLNDWLLHEFRERVGRTRKLLLTERLSAGLKAAQITVTKQEEESEKRFLKRRPKEGVGSTAARQAYYWEQALKAYRGGKGRAYHSFSDVPIGPVYDDGPDDGPDDDGPDDGPEDDGPDDGPDDDGPDDDPDDDTPDDGPDDDRPDDGPDDDGPDDGPDDDGPDDGPEDDGPDDGPEDDGPDDGPDDDEPDDGPDDDEPDDGPDDDDGER